MISQLQKYLQNVGYNKEQQLTRKRVLGDLPEGEYPIGIAFDAPLFTPLQRGITLARRALDFPEDSAWLLCLDEAEFLEPVHHRILNTYLRSQVNNLFFKITTMPYCHYTLETNARVSLNVGHDFEYVYIDQDPISQVSEGSQGACDFANQIFMKRLATLGTQHQGITLRDWLGASELLDRKESDWGPDSANMALLRKYADGKTIERAERLSDLPDKLYSEVARKIHGALLLRDAVSSQGKGLNVYSGASMVVRCADGNPRRLIRILNRFLQKTLKAGENADRGSIKPLSSTAQTRILRGFSGVALSRVQSEPEVGPELYDLLNLIGNYMYSRLHKRPLTIDQVSSLIVSEKDSHRYWKLVKYAIGLGLLFPNVSVTNPDQMPERKGIFHFAYVLAPHFLLLPRRGKEIGLLSILANASDYQIPLELLGKEED
ncbi:MAG: hypothetical protein KAV99_06430 [Candidatus Latescibacteria bacterium]|nr:hypothetical protein [Candidatus Latescibacterota bacterium]